MSKEMKITVVPPEVFSEEDYREPSRYFCVSATGDRFYFHTADRAKAQEECDKQFSKGKYTIRTDKMQKGGEITVRGSMNSRSRAGTYIKNLHEGQGK